MARTTLNLDASVLAQLRDQARKEHKSLGELASELLCQALARPGGRPQRKFKWIAKPLNSRFPMNDWARVKQFLDDEDNEPYR